MRRLVALLVVSFAGALAFGFSSFSSGLHVGAATVSGSTFRSELAAIAATPNIQCYLTALNPTNYAKGAGADTFTTSGAAAWATLRVEGLAIDQYVATTLHYTPTKADLASATSSLEGEMTQAALASQLTCPGSSAQALASMPAEMRAAQVKSQATSLYLLSRLNSTIPLTTSSLQAYYRAHQSSYDTLCVSVALVAPSQLSAFSQAQAAGATVAQLAKKFSLDPSAAKGGTYGCYGPSASSYQSVRADVGTTSLNTFPTTPLSVSSNGTTYALFVAPTSRTVTPFAQAEASVLSDVRNANASSASTVKQSILYHAAVAVDPAFGRWGLSSSGPSVFAPALPKASSVASTSTLTNPTTTPYQ